VAWLRSAHLSPSSAVRDDLPRSAARQHARRAEDLAGGRTLVAIRARMLASRRDATYQCRIKSGTLRVAGGPAGRPHRQP
jgi:hypothetical protein